MNSTQLILTILSSSLLAAVLTAVVNYRLSHINYKNEYYKKLLDSRLKAYEKVYVFVCNLKMHVHDEEESTLVPLLLNEGVEEFEKQIILLLVPIRDSMWLSDELNDELTKLNLYLHTLLGEIQHAPNPDSALRKLSTQRLNDIRNGRKKIQSIMAKDMRHMHNIKSFLNQII